MHILILSINYAPEKTGFAPHVTALSEYLVRRGDKVTVFTGFPFAPRWQRLPEDRGKFMQREERDGVIVVRLSHYIPRTAGRMGQRMLMEGTFCLSSALRFFARWQKYDLILYVGAQPSVAMAARMFARLRRIPYVVAINDLAAEAAADVGIVRARWLRRLLERFEYAAYSRASGAIVLCSAFRDALLLHDYPADRIAIIRSPVDVEAIKPLQSDEFRRQWGIAADSLVVLYAGSMGIKQGLVNVIDAAEIVRARRPDVVWVLVGDGEVRPVLERAVKERGLQDMVRLEPLQSEELMSAMFGAADVLLLNQIGAVKNTVIPSKLLTYMAAGKAVVAAVNADSQGAHLLREANGGFLVPPDDPAALAEAIAGLEKHDDLVAMGMRNREFAVKNFDQDVVIAAQREFLRRFLDVSGGSGGFHR